MARYEQRAQEANAIAQSLLSSLPPGVDKMAFAVAITKIFNLGIRVSPRGVQGTVRIKAIQGMLKDIPITARLQEVSRNGYSFNALVLTPQEGDTTPIIDDGSDEE